MIEFEKIEVVDFSGEKFSKFSIPCSVILILVFLLTVINVILTVLFPGSFISTLLSLGIIVIFVLYFYFVATKNLGKMRTFSISTEEIRFSIPNIPIFQILWAEFDKIEIKLKSFQFEPYSRYYFHFIQDQLEKTFDISLWDFPKKKIDHILVLIKNYAGKYEKVFTAVKEKKISGIYQVENLDI